MIGVGSKKRVVAVAVEMITFPSSEEREMGSNGGWKIHTLSHGET